MKEAAVEGSHFLFVDFAAEGAQFALDALADHRTFVIVPCAFFQRCVNMPVGNPTGAKVAGNAEFSLLVRFGPMSRKLLRIPCVIDQPVFFQASYHQLDKQFVIAAPLELLLQFVDGVGTPRQCAQRHIVQLCFCFKLARLGEHEERMK